MKRNILLGESFPFQSENRSLYEEHDQKERELNNTIQIKRHEKGSLGRTLKVSPKTIVMINNTRALLDEAKQLLETGFEYVTDREGVKLFRRRK